MSTFHLRLGDMPLTLQPFTKLTTAEQHQTETFYTKFNPNRSRNVEIRVKISFRRSAKRDCQ
jgi:hypothetical protein